jgi:hypothetical protein
MLVSSLAYPEDGGDIFLRNVSSFQWATLRYDHVNPRCFSLSRFGSYFARSCLILLFFKLVEWGGVGVQLGPPGTAATNRPIVPAPGDYDDGEIGGMMIGRG